MLLLLLALAALPAGAAVPETMTFQGVLTEDAAPFTGTAELGFAIYAKPSGGIPLWTRPAAATVITDGLYTVELEALGELGFDQPYWLEVVVDGDPLAPRYPLHSVPYAMRALTAEQVGAGGVDGDAVLDGSLTAADLGINVVSSIAGVTHDGGDIDLRAGANIKIIPDRDAKTITIASEDGLGADDIRGGAGLIASTREGAELTLDVSGGPGIAVTADAVQLSEEFLTGKVYDRRFVRRGDAGSVTPEMFAADFIGSLAGIKAAGGDIELVAGSNIEIKADPEAKRITISAAEIPVLLEALRAQQAEIEKLRTDNRDLDAALAALAERIAALEGR
jgi:hypothetical protein